MPPYGWLDLAIGRRIGGRSVVHGPPSLAGRVVFSGLQGVGEGDGWGGRLGWYVDRGFIGFLEGRMSVLKMAVGVRVRGTVVGVGEARFSGWGLRRGGGVKVCKTLGY